MRWIRRLWIRVVLRPLGRCLGTTRWEPWLVYRERCLQCGHTQIVAILADTPCYDPETKAIWGTQCSVCGEMTCTSFGETLDEPVERRPV